MREIRQYAIALVTVLSCAAPGRAAFISEVFVGDGGSGMPTSVELDLLQVGTADTVELIIIDATPARLGDVQRVISIPAATSATQLFTESDWATDIWTGREVPVNNHTTLSDLGEGTSFELAKARSLMLYSGPTSVEETSVDSLFSDKQQDRLDGASLLDAFTLSLDGTTPATDAPGPHLNIAPGSAMVRPLSGPGLGPRLAGEVTAGGYLAGLSPPLELTPGERNPNYTADDPVPEPATGTLLLAAVGAILTRRPIRHCSMRPIRLSSEVVSLHHMFHRRHKGPA